VAYFLHDSPLRAKIMEENASGKLPPAASGVSPMTESGIPKVWPKNARIVINLLNFRSVSIILVYY